MDIEINGNIVYSFNGPSATRGVTADFDAVTANAVTVRVSRTAPGIPSVGENTFKLADLGTNTDVEYSGELLTATPVYYLEQLPKYKEFHFESFAAGTSVIQTQKGYESLWFAEAAKVLKMDCYSNSTANINCLVNGVPVFQNPVQTGADRGRMGVFRPGY